MTHYHEQREDEMKKREQRLEELRKQREELTKEIEQLESIKVWEPEGGDYYVRDNGDVLDCPTDSGTKLFGTERKTREQAEKARDKMRVFNRLLAYVDEACGGYDFVMDGDNYYIELNNGVYIMDFDVNFMKVGAIYMPEQVAIELCKKLNSGEVVL